MNNPPNLTWLPYLRTLDDAYKSRPPIQYIVGGLFALPSLNVVYSPPGGLKSMILADMAICVTSGIPWLERAPWEMKPLKPFSVIQSPVLWLDFDNGSNRTSNRFEALGREYKVPADAPLFYFSMPSPPLDISKTGHVVDLIDIAKQLAAKLIVIDNLATISGGRDENTSEMLVIMANLRLLSERTGAAVVPNHHSRKETGYKGKQGDNLRGFSGIRGAIDTGLYIDRETNSDIVTIRAEKTRDVEIPPFGAVFTYTHKPGCNDLATARFYQVAVLGAETDQDIESAVIDALKGAGTCLNQTNLIKETKKSLKSGEKRIADIINRMVARKVIKCSSGPRGSHVYTI